LKDTDLLNLLINKTVTIAIEKGIIRSKSIIVDATHTLSRSNPFLAIDVLRERSKLLRKTVYTFDDQFKERMPEKNSDNDLEKELVYCKELEKRIENEPSISSIPAVKEKLNLLKETVEDRKDADRFVCPAGHLAIKKTRGGSKNIGTNQVDTYYFDVEKCKSCKLKNGCYKDGAKTKTYSVSIKSELHQDQMAFQETEYYKEKAKHRYKIEAKNSELKNVHGYDKAISYGITNMQMQGAIAIFTVNLKRILKLM
jgi:hypothetical protein